MAVGVDAVSGEKTSVNHTRCIHPEWFCSRQDVAVAMVGVVVGFVVGGNDVADGQV